MGKKRTKRPRSPEVALLWDLTQVASKVHAAPALAADMATEVYRKVCGEDPREFEGNLPYVGFVEALRALEANMPDYLEQMPLTIPTSVEAWLVHRWAHTPVLYKPHPDLLQALMESEPPDVVDGEVLARLHGATWAAVIPEGVITDSEVTGGVSYRYLIGGVSYARFEEGPGYAIGTLGVSPTMLDILAKKLSDVPANPIPSAAAFISASSVHDVYGTGDDVDSALQRAVINLGLYLASERVDVDLPQWKPSQTPTREATRPRRPMCVGLGGKVGPRLGAVLDLGRRARPAQGDQGGSHASPVAHWRRGHWRNVWVGPRANGQPGTHRVPRWVEPTIVGMGEPSPTQRTLR